MPSRPLDVQNCYCSSGPDHIYEVSALKQLPFHEFVFRVAQYYSPSSLSKSFLSSALLRAGHKLEAVIELLEIDVTGKVILDSGTFYWRSTYIVHMDKSSIPKAFSSHHYWYSSILESVKTSLDGNGVGPKLVYTYDNAFHGFSAVVSKDELEVLRKSPGFLSAYEDGIVTPDTTHTYKFLNLNTVSGLWPASQYGKDVIIGVVDSGVWPESPSFKDDGMTEIPARWKGKCQEGEEFNSSLCNKKLIGAQYFNAGVRAANPGVNITLNSARDDDGHGTHVGSTAAGNYVDGVSFFGYAPGTARGVAPRARLAAYKVLWNEGSYESDALAGIDQAVADGVDVLSISLSYRRTDLYENPIAIAGFGAREKGILVSLSAGNRGPSTATLLEGIPWAFVVASGTVDRWFAGTLTLGNGKRITGWTMFPLRAVVRNLPLVYNSTLSACNSTALLSEAPSDSIIVCNQTDDTTDFFFLMRYLTASNVRAAIIISEDTSILRSISFPHPGVVITPKEARDVIKYARNNDTARATIDFCCKSFPVTRTCTHQHLQREHQKTDSMGHQKVSN
ncbi:subtilisin-like protease [Dorcoceras hygrometricum]|uniref:Subtilisin-like protease n=1 Tax=Dorcoceras hygrometricum TaxID=472368 RepID=A0A2Z7BTG8_9LAMI|nr:subtilisin-like protease [Dorcoceras hygrometricum]